MSTTTSYESTIKDALKAKLAEQGYGGHHAAPKAKATPKPVIDLFNAIAEQDTRNKVSYADIVGEKHPSGRDYWFTKHETSSWSPELRDLIPEVNHTHVFDHDYALALLMGIEYDKNVFAYGAPGTGKSVTPAQICARINYPFIFIGGMGGTEPADYIGSPWVADGNMEWKDAAASYAVRHGAFLLYDEPFKASAQTNMCFQSLMDSRRELKLYGHPDPIKGNLKAHPRFRMALADNVRGLGDSMDKYAAEVQDQSFLNRCAYKVHVDYVKADVEETILGKIYPESTAELRKKVVSLAGLIRAGWKKGDIGMPYSLRDTQEFIEAAMIHRDAAEAFRQTFFGYVEEEQEVKALADMWKLVFPTIKLV